ncbi:hypothetical protein DEDE109153_09585 [Deinococcus deserti]
MRRGPTSAVVALTEHERTLLTDLVRRRKTPRALLILSLTPPKVNAKRVDPRWKPEYGAARKCIESAFSVLVGAGLRWGQVKTYLSLRLKVALNVLAHNLKYIDLSP